EHELVGVVTQPDKPVGREQRIEPTPIKRAIAKTAIPILQPARIKDQSSIEEIRALKADVIVVMAYGQILPSDVLKIPRLTCLNRCDYSRPETRHAFRRTTLRQLTLRN